jgi:hypothetical protein
MNDTRHSGVRRPRTEGPALVLTCEPRATYRAHLTLDAGLIHATEVELRRGAYEDAWFAPVADRAWTPREIREIRWLDRVAA